MNACKLMAMLDLLLSKEQVENSYIALVVCRGDIRGTCSDPPAGPQMLPAASYGHETVCQACLGWSEAGLHGFVGERERCRWDPKHMRAERASRFWTGFLVQQAGNEAGMPGHFGLVAWRSCNLGWRWGGVGGLRGCRPVGLQ